MIEIEPNLYFQKPPILYKYLPSARIDVVQNHRLKVTRHEEFDDIFDSFHVEEPADLDELNIIGAGVYFLELSPWDVMDKAARETAQVKMYQWVQESARRYPGYSLDCVYQINPILGAENRRAHAEGFWGQYVFDAQNPLLLCLSGNPVNRTMWERYAEASKGFCIGFDSNAKSINGCGRQGIRRVIYSSEPCRGPIQVALWRRWIIKHPDYSNESEWRSQFDINMTTEVVSGETNIRTISFEPEDIKSITIGARMSIETKEKLLETVPDGVEIYKISPAWKEFSRQRIR